MNKLPTIMNALSICQFKIIIKMIEMRVIIYIINERSGTFLEIEENKQNIAISGYFRDSLNYYEYRYFLILIVLQKPSLRVSHLVS